MAGLLTCFCCRRLPGRIFQWHRVIVCNVARNLQQRDCKALDHEWGIMESQEAFGTTKKAMIASGREKILVVDSTKFDQTAFSVAGKLRDIDVVVTDRKPSEKWLAHFAEEGVECRYPGMQP